MINLSRSNDQHGSRVESKHKSTALARTTPKSKSRFAKQMSRYEELKAIVQTYFEQRVKAGAALKEIHDDKLYKEEYKTFEDFCQNECGMSRAQAYRQMELPAMAESLHVSKVETKNLNESQVRALSGVQKSKREIVLMRVAESGEPMSAKAITEATKPRELKKKSKPKIIDVEPEPQRPAPTQQVKHCPTCTCE